ncbi:hypothetical protein BpHYR1_029865 [Brachionus plicatilis]|uniref:Uncharacterized protein n=1 Tax=Brachionus plicatilis TaxID=10195 RepID=A0A3M7S8U9_BRAPC|nr:hypothetical protein BpHYR1_029865 [Brachionus plicatilis]
MPTASFSPPSPLGFSLMANPSCGTPSRTSFGLGQVHLAPVAPLLLIDFHSCLAHNTSFSLDLKSLCLSFLVVQFQTSGLLMCRLYFLAFFASLFQYTMSLRSPLILGSIIDISHQLIESRVDSVELVV